MLSLTPQNLVTREELRSYRLPATLPQWNNNLRPQKSTWMPIHHYELVTSSLESLEEKGFEIIEEMYTSYDKGHSLIGAIKVKVPDITNDHGLSYCFVFKNNNTGKNALIFMLAGEVDVCANGCVFGEIHSSVKRKHSHNYSVKDRVLEGVSMFQNQLVASNNNVTLMKEFNIDTKQGNHLIIEAARNKVIPPTLILKTSNEWEASRHQEFHPRNAWSLYNAFTEACKSRPPRLQLETCTKSKSFIQQYLDNWKNNET